MTMLKVEEQAYSKQHLTYCVSKLLKLFNESWETAHLKKLFSKGKENRWVKQKVNWDNKTDCFTQVLFETYYNKDGMLAVGIGVVIRGGIYCEGGNITSFGFFSGTLREILLWANAKDTLSDCISKIEKLIDKFFDN